MNKYFVMGTVYIGFFTGLTFGGKGHFQEAYTMGTWHVITIFFLLLIPFLCGYYSNKK